jgi:hypothetical protein
MITANFYNPQRAKVEAFDDFVSLDVLAEDGARVSIFIRGNDRAERAEAAAAAINAAIGAKP